MSKLIEDIKAARRKGHNMIMVWNNNANCLNILNARKPNEKSLRLALSKDDFGSQNDDFVKEGIRLDSLIESKIALKLNILIDSWKE